MSGKRIGWAAVAVFAAAMTVAEALAIHAVVRDARSWLAGENALEIRRAGAALAGMVGERLGSPAAARGGCATVTLAGGEARGACVKRRGSPARATARSAVRIES